MSTESKHKVVMGGDRLSAIQAKQDEFYEAMKKADETMKKASSLWDELTSLIQEAVITIKLVNAD